MPYAGWGSERDRVARRPVVPVMAFAHGIATFPRLTTDTIARMGRPLLSIKSVEIMIQQRIQGRI